MCPDPQILSIYLDGELPSPWKEKLEAHINACRQCREKLENYKRVHDLILKGSSRTINNQKRTVVETESHSPINAICLNETEVLEKSKEKVWKRLASKQKYSPSGLTRTKGNIRQYSVWRRKLIVPIPIAAAVLVFFAIGAFLYIRNVTTQNNYNNQFAEFTNLIEEMPDNFLPSAVHNNIDSVLQYISNSRDGDIIILQLPESRSFTRSGEPAIIRAQDYSRMHNASLENTQRRRQP